MAKAKSTTSQTVDVNQIKVVDPIVLPSTNQNTTPDNTTNINNKVVKIIQKRPSHYSLLMEDGTTKVVHKTLFDKSTMTIVTD